MTATVSVSSKDSSLDLTAPTNFVQTEMWRSVIEVFEPNLPGVLEDLEDAEDGESTRRLYKEHGAAAFLPYVK